MTEDQELAGGTRLMVSKCHAQMIAAMLLRNALRANTVLAPLFGDDRAATVGRRLFEAGGFRSHETPQDPKHIGELRLQKSK